MGIRSRCGVSTLPCSMRFQGFLAEPIQGQTFIEISIELRVLSHKRTDYHQCYNLFPCYSCSSSRALPQQIQATEVSRPPRQPAKLGPYIIGYKNVNRPIQQPRRRIRHTSLVDHAHRHLRSQRKQHCKWSTKLNTRQLWHC